MTAIPRTPGFPGHKARAGGVVRLGCVALGDAAPLLAAEEPGPFAGPPAWSATPAIPREDAR